jgi:ABC-type nickel/cobalt efflux system permease component RcnA
VLRSIWQCSTPGRSPAPGALYYIILYYIILYHIISYAANSAHLDDRPPEGQAQEDQLAGEVEGGLDQGVGRQQGLDPPLEEGQAQARQRVLQGTESWSVTDPYLAIVARLLWCARGTSDGSGVSRSSGSIGLDSHHVCAANPAKIIIRRRSPSTRFAKRHTHTHTHTRTHTHTHTHTHVHSRSRSRPSLRMELQPGSSSQREGCCCNVAIVSAVVP